MSRTCPICNGEVEDSIAKCPLCGFHLEGSTESFAPIIMDTGNDIPGASAEQRYELRVVRGPQTGIDIKLHEGILTVGRDPNCDIFLNDMTVSRMHAGIEVGDKGCIIRDANSFNGVWVNDRMEETCLLKSGDVVQIGAFCLVYRERA